MNVVLDLQTLRAVTANVGKPTLASSTVTGTAQEKIVALRLEGKKQIVAEVLSWTDRERDDRYAGESS